MKQPESTIAHATLFAQLADYFPEEQVRFREGKNGGHYLKAPNVMNRLDSVLGPAGWWDVYQVLDELTVECALTIRLPDGSTLTKRDVGIRKPMDSGKVDPGCSWKAAYSDALKRAAVKFGVGRHLCKCGFADFVEGALTGTTLGSDSGAPVPISPPPAPGPPVNGHAPAPIDRPARDGLPSQARPPTPPEPREGGRGNHPPRSGSALWRWAKDQEEAHGAGLIKYLTGWAKLQEFPGLMKEWTAVQVGEAHAEALRRLATLADAVEHAA